MQEVPKPGNRIASGWVVVVRPEERVELRIGVERGLNPLEGIGMNADISVDEHEHLGGRPGSAAVPRCRRVNCSGRSTTISAIRTVAGRLDGSEAAI